MLTNFAALTQEEKTLWSLDLWKHAREMSFIDKFLGKDSNSVIQHVDELKKSEKGARAVITLLADLTGDGVAGDRTLEGNEEAQRTHDQVIRIDQLRHGSRHEGRMANQKSIVEFRSNAKNALAYWLAERMDQMALLAMAGVGYNRTCNGALRPTSDLQNLEFAADITPPSGKRRARWNKTTGRLEFGGATTDVTAGDTISWEMLINLKTAAHEKFIRPVKHSGGSECFHVFLNPRAMQLLKLDPEYIQNLRHALPRDSSNPLFTGDTVHIDGLYLHTDRRVYNTMGAAAGDKWGAAADIDGCSIMLAGAQALAMADIGNPEWNEKGFDYDNQQGISTGKILGFLKPQFETIYEPGTKEDFGVINVFTAI